ncbi:MAG: sigma 54-interacting transcriptional regulator, partial [Pirellulaceae bacterium]|nr:sigma 54-interacting transcriptional regulator [Pirellulaceae bacterium]
MRQVAEAGELIDWVDDDSEQHVVILPVASDTPKRNGWKLIEDLRRRSELLPIVAAADQGSVEAAARAIAAGASDFLVCGEKLPERIATLLGKLRGLLDVMERNRRLDEQNTQLRESLQQRFQLVGDSAPMRRLFEQIQRVARVARPVLVLGERGTGKELVARAIHLAGGSPARPLVTLNCAAFNDALLESELFGHEKGAFTGADSVRRGAFERADGGTLFLDEVGNMSVPFQEKILRVVEYGLFDRLTFETLELPPLRQREADVELLARHFLDEFSLELPSLGKKTLSPAALAALRTYRFPGNVRELKNIIERAAYRSAAEEILPADLGLTTPDDLAGQTGTFAERTALFARRLITEALSQSDGNQAAAARSLGLSYHQFRYYLK